VAGLGQGMRISKSEKDFKHRRDAKSAEKT